MNNPNDGQAKVHRTLEKNVDSVSPLDTPPQTSFFDICSACGALLRPNRSPQLLPCLHSLCKMCIPSHEESITERRKECPVCEWPYTLLEIKDNPFLKDPTPVSDTHDVSKCAGCDGATVSGWCVECGEALCSVCISAHQRVRVTRDHTVLPQRLSQGSAPTVFCSSHKEEPMKLYCTSCDQLTCRDCQLSYHRNHSHQFLDNALKTQKEQLKSCMARVKQQRQAVKQSLLDLEGRLLDLTTLKSGVYDDLQKALLQIRYALMKNAVRLIKNVQGLCGSETEKVKERQAVLRKLQERQEHVLNFIEKALEMENHSALLSCRRKIQSQVQNILSQPVSPAASMLEVQFHCDQDCCDRIFEFGKIITKEVPFARLEAHSVPNQTPGHPVQNQDFNTQKPPSSPLYPFTSSSVTPTTSQTPETSAPSAPTFLHHPSPTSYSHTQGLPQSPSFTRRKDKRWSFHPYKPKNPNTAPRMLHTDTTAATTGAVQNAVRTHSGRTSPPVESDHFHGNVPPNQKEQPSWNAPCFHLVKAPADSPCERLPPAGCEREPALDAEHHPAENEPTSTVTESGGVPPAQALNAETAEHVPGRWPELAPSQLVQRDPPHHRHTGNTPIKMQHGEPSICSNMSDQSILVDLNWSVSLQGLLANRNPPPKASLKNTKQPTSLLELLTQTQSFNENDPTGKIDPNGSPEEARSFKDSPVTNHPLFVKHQAYKGHFSFRQEGRADAVNGDDSGVYGPSEPVSRDWLPQVSVLRLPTSLPLAGQFRLLPGSTKHKVLLQAIDEDDGSSPRNSTSSSEKTWPALLSPACSACQRAGNLLWCVECGRGFHKDCHIPPISSAPRGKWKCLLCWDLSDDADPYSWDRDRRPSLTLLDQRKCEYLLLVLLCKKSGSVFHHTMQLSSHYIDINLIRGRLLRKLSPPYRTPSEFVSDIWVLLDTLMKNLKDINLAMKLQKSFQKKLNKIFGNTLHPSLLRCPDSEEGKVTRDVECEGELWSLGSTKPTFQYAGSQSEEEN